MRLLLDTHAALWWWTEPARLSPTARSAIADRRNLCHFSPASSYELAQKQRCNPGLLPSDFLPGLPAILTEEEWCHLPLLVPHTLHAGLHPSPHRDPFDRLLAAQAELETLTLVTCDPAFASFPIRTLW